MTTANFYWVLTKKFLFNGVGGLTLVGGVYNGRNFSRQRGYEQIFGLWGAGLPLQSSPSVSTPFSCKTSIASSLSCQLEAFNWKPSNVTQAFSPKFPFATLQSQPVCCKLLLATIQPQPFIHKLLEVFSCNSLVSSLHSQSFIPNFSVPSSF